MPSDDEPIAGGQAAEPNSPGQRIAAFSVHIFTASGAALALLATIAAVRGAWALMFFWLGIALIVDGLDGTFARRVRAAEVLPRWSGDILDAVVDFTTYVFVPAYAIAMSNLLPDSLAVALGAIIVMTSALYFADRSMKTTDNYFRGFPAVWNVIVFYLFILKPNPWLAAAVIVLFAVMTFLPITFVHPVRVRRLRVVSVSLLVIWSVLALYALAKDLEPGPVVGTAMTAVAAYFLAVGFLRRNKLDLHETT
jgi:phosphatidylcholine synthase